LAIWFHPLYPQHFAAPPEIAQEKFPPADICVSHEGSSDTATGA
jgi:hypothetical protein